MSHSPSGHADDWHFCLNPLVPKEFQYKPSSVVGNETVIEADKMESGEDSMNLTGNVQFKRDYATISADSAQYQTKSQQLEAVGNVRISTPELTTIGDKATVQLKNDAGTIDNAKFWLSGSHIRGDSKRIEFINSNESRFTSSTFTSCAEEDPAWMLATSSLSINTEENEAVATHARLTFQGVPVFYFPYLELNQLNNPNLL